MLECFLWLEKREVAWNVTAYFVERWYDGN